MRLGKSILTAFQFVKELRFTGRVLEFKAVAILALFLLFLPLMQCQQNPGSTAEEPDDDTPIGPTLPIADLEAILTEHCQTDPELLAAGICVDKRGYPVWNSLYGYTDSDKSKAISPNNLFILGSVTKTWIATMILQLVEEDRIDLNGSIAKYLPEPIAMVLFREYSQDITVYQLLSHRSGIYNYFRTSFLNMLKTQTEHHYTPLEIITMTVDQGYVVFEPGQQYDYSNSNYILLGCILENVCGKPLNNILRERIYDKINLQNTFLQDFDHYSREIAHGYQAGVDGSRIHGSAGWAAGALLSTPKDLSTFMRTLMDGELFQNDSTLIRMQTPSENSDYGCGMITMVHEDYGRVYYHSGGLIGFVCFMFYFEDLDIVISGFITATRNILEIQPYADLMFPILDLLRNYNQSS